MSDELDEISIKTKISVMKNICRLSFYCDLCIPSRVVSIAVIDSGCNKTETPFTLHTFPTTLPYKTSVENNNNNNNKLILYPSGIHPLLIQCYHFSYVTSSKHSLYSGALFRSSCPQSSNISHTIHLLYSRTLHIRDTSIISFPDNPVAAPSLSVIGI